MRCLIMGGTGFIGRNLCEALLKNKHEVVIYGRNREHLINLKKIYRNIHIINGDIVLEKNFNYILNKIDVVFYLISTTNVSNTNLAFDIESNVLPTLHFLEACVENNINKIIYLSSGGTVYGIPKYTPIKEGHEINPISSYGMHKAMVEKSLQYYNIVNGLDYIILRVSNPYGQWQNPFLNQGIIAVLIYKLLNDKTVEIWGSGEVIRDYIYIDDLIDACIKSIFYSGKYKIFNIGSGKGFSINDILDKIEKLSNKKAAILFCEKRKQDVLNNLLDISLAKKELNWQPRKKINEGILEMIKMWDSEKKCFLKGV